MTPPSTSRHTNATSSGLVRSILNRPTVRELLTPLTVAALVTWALCSHGGDQMVARAAFGSTETPWPIGNTGIWQALYDFGPMPGIVLAVGGLLCLIFSPCAKSLRRWRRAAGFLTLVMLLGPGLLINGVLKPEWGRPRPRQLVEFGGSESYRAVWQPMNKAPGRKSFPSGHASIGFFLMVPYFLLRRHRRAGRVILMLGIGAGALVGLARIFQGAHFVTDVFWSGVLVYATGWCISQVLLKDAVERSAQPTIADPSPGTVSVPVPAVPENALRVN